MPGHLWSPGMGLHGFHVNNKPSIGVAQRARVAGHTLRRPRVTPNARDALLFPATVPSGF